MNNIILKIGMQESSDTVLRFTNNSRVGRRQGFNVLREELTELAILDSKNV